MWPILRSRATLTISRTQITNTFINTRFKVSSCHLLLCLSHLFSSTLTSRELYENQGYLPEHCCTTMPKRTKTIARAQQRAEAKAQTSNQQKASNTSNPKLKKTDSVQSSQEISSVSTTTLGTRFASLPAELRAEIFAWLLVRPVKWSAEHEADCPLRNPEETSSPFEDIRPRMNPSRETCPLAYCGIPASRWRSRGQTIYKDPWRSEWAPVITSEFLCSVCWDARFRSHPAPRIDSLPCLCARKRRDGLAALLVCKKWYEEGARVRVLTKITCE